MSQVSFAQLKKNRGSVQEMAEKLATSKGGNQNRGDNRFYYPKLDENKNGYAVIRFLAAAPGDEFPIVKTYSHGFKSSGGWFIEECPTTIGKDCPVCKANSELVNKYGGWDSTPKDIKDGTIRLRKRKMQYVANVLVVQDSKNPENEGKVFLFKFGPRIFNKLEAAMAPQFEDETPVNPFDFWEGANFKLKIRLVDGNINYDSSSFDVVSAIADTDKAIEEIWKKQYSLQEFTSEGRFKEYVQLEKNFARASGQSTTSDTRSANQLAEDDVPVQSAPETKSEAAPKQKAAAPADEEDDDILAQFKAMAEDD